MSVKMIGIYRNKRANVWINILVILVLATCIAVGFTFLTGSNKKEAIISGIGIMDEVYLGENEFYFYFQLAGNEAVRETYNQIDIGETPTENSFFPNFQKKFESYGLDKNYLKKDNFKIDSSKKLLRVLADNFEIRKNFADGKNHLEILHRKSFIFEFNLK